MLILTLPLSPMPAPPQPLQIWRPANRFVWMESAIYCAAKSCQMTELLSQKLFFQKVREELGTLLRIFYLRHAFLSYRKSCRPKPSAYDNQQPLNPQLFFSSSLSLSEQGAPPAEFLRVRRWRPKRCRGGLRSRPEATWVEEAGREGLRGDPAKERRAKNEIAKFFTAKSRRPGC